MAYWGWLGLLLVLWVMPANAAVEELEIIAGIEGTSPLDAQEKAVDYAKKRAFFLTLSRLAPEKAKQIAESLTSDQIDTHIRGYELIEDKIDKENPNYYLAKYKVSVSQDMVKRLLVADGAATDDAANPMLILPVLRDEDRILLWENDNIWRSIWNGVALEQGEGVLVMPYGDPKDTLITDSATVLGYGWDEMAELAGRYGAGEVVVVVATYLREPKPGGVDVVLRRLGPAVNKVKSVYFEADSRHETPESVLPEAARSLAGQLKDIARTYQGEQLKRLANASRVTLRAEFRRLDDWVRLQETLGALPRVLELQVNRINIVSAEATLIYDTQPELMQEIMRANGLFVQPEGDHWRVAVP